MTWWPEIREESMESGRIVLRLGVPETLDCFPGHFPGWPILPGVLQVHWAIKFARDRLAIAGEFAALEGVKFQSIVRPETELLLELALDERGRLTFDYSSATGRHSSGRVVFKNEF
jgi:3-hydroxymyristoyl/3-hydroxydecanoyl-(acyl carrier protein) dehydratase